MKRVAVVTGGARGIGLAIVELLLLEGWRVAVWDVDREALLASVPLDGERCLAVVADIAQEASVRDAAARTWAWAGRLDGLVNNAGIANPTNEPLLQLPLSEWNRILATNLTGPLLCAKHCAAKMAHTGGAIVNIASTRARMAEPNTEAYSASKGGLLALTRALAVSLGPKIRVNAISPGWIHVTDHPLSPSDHEQHPVGRVGRPEDIARAVSFLLSETEGFLTGAELIIDGGMTCKMIYEEPA